MRGTSSAINRRATPKWLGGYNTNHKIKRSYHEKISINYGDEFNVRYS